MTIIYDPLHAKYLDEADTREELTRVYDLCHGCRLCFKFCPSFPTLFSYIDAHDDQDAGKMTPAQQDHVADECFQCKLCYVNCPYTPGIHEWALDFPRLMLRVDAMRRANGQVSTRSKITTAMLGRTDALGMATTSESSLFIFCVDSINVFAVFTSCSVTPCFNKSRIMPINKGNTPGFAPFLNSLPESHSAYNLMSPICSKKFV